MCDFSKASETEKYFKNVINVLEDSKIIYIFSNAPFWFIDKHITYMQDEPLYIAFDNGRCLVIEYYEINKLTVEYREMTEYECNILEKSDIKDLFNRTTKIYYGHNSEHIETSELSYDKLEKIELKSVTEEYSAWINGRMKDGIKPTKETFNEIKFIMKNGKSFSICADDAESDGYSLIWSDDAKISV